MNTDQIPFCDRLTPDGRIRRVLMENIHVPVRQGMRTLPLAFGLLRRTSTLRRYHERVRPMGRPLLGHAGGR